MEEPVRLTLRSEGVKSPILVDDDDDDVDDDDDDVFSSTLPFI
jgi:hypothetical protein